MLIGKKLETEKTSQHRLRIWSRNPEIDLGYSFCTFSPTVRRAASFLKWSAKMEWTSKLIQKANQSFDPIVSCYRAICSV